MSANQAPSANATNTDQVVADLSINTVVKSKAKIGIGTAAITNAAADYGGGAGFGTNAQSQFNVKGLSLVGDGIKKIEITNVVDDGFAFAEMTGYLV